MTATASPLLDPRVLAGLGQLELVARTVVEGFLTGLHRSVQHGFSVEFADFRPYTPGDDPRFIDWNGYARTDRTYVRRYRGETNTQLVLLLDASASMGYQGRGIRKLDYARFLAAALGFLARRQHDPVGWLIFDRQIRDLHPPSSRPGHFHALLAALEACQPAAGTDLEAVFGDARPVMRRRGMVAVLSDFYADPAALLDRVRPLAHRSQDIVLFQLLDPDELDPALAGPTQVVDLETGERRQVDADPGYRERVQRHVATLREGAAAIGADHVLLDTAKPLDTALRAYLALRRRRA